jgi:hypothetical protein
MNKYSDPTLKDNAPFALLPVESFNKITWRGGDDALSALLDLDPGAYLGEFRSMIGLEGTKDRDAIVFPVLPWKVVTRRSGRETYKRYSTTEMYFRPITARSRFVKYAKNDKGQREKGDNGRNKIVAVSQKFPGKGSGFDPQKEVFGVVHDGEGNPVTYACLVLDAWSSYLSYNKAAAKFENIKHAETELPIYLIGTRGIKSDGVTVRKANVFNGFSSVDIEPLDVDKCKMMEVDQAFDDMWQAAQEWANCPRWHSETGVVYEPEHVNELPPMPPVTDDFPFGDPAMDEVHA